MKIINIILSVFILLLAAASAVFSFFLFEKRSQFVSGWSKMATAINQAAVELDRGSDTKSASKLTTAALAHEKYADLDQVLPELAKQSKTIIQERNILAQNLRNIGGNVNMPNLPSMSAFQSVLTAPANAEEVLKAVDRTVRNRDKVYNQLANTSRDLGLSLDRSKLLRGDVSPFYSWSGKFRSERNRRLQYEQQLMRLSSQLNAGVRSSDFAGNNYQNASRKIQNAINQLKNLQRKTLSERNSARNTVIENKRQIKSLQNNIANLHQVVKEKDYNVSTLGRLNSLFPDNFKIHTPWQPGSKDARRAVIGHVVSVNNKYGYLVVDLGKDTVVKQQVVEINSSKDATKSIEEVDDKYILEINPQIVEGLELTIYRLLKSKDTDKVENDVVGVAKITNVGLSQSIVNLPFDGKPIKPGDLVRISQTSLDNPPEKKANKTNANK